MYHVSPQGTDQCMIKVLVTTEGFMSEVRSWSAPAWQLNGWQLSLRPTVAGTDKLNSLIFIRSKTPPYLVMTDQSESSTAFKILMGTALKKISSIILIHTSAFSHLQLKLTLLTTRPEGEKGGVRVDF